MCSSKATCEAASPHTDPVWEPNTSDLKTYRHFDAMIPKNDILAFAADPDYVAKHTFRPLIHFEKKWRRAPKMGADGKKIARKPKVRPIRYACRKDAYIYKHYRSVLSESYENLLVQKKISASVLAYRRISINSDSTKHKSNIHFAQEAFELVKTLGKCCAIAIDISDFFGSINHTRLKAIWQTLLGCSSLPKDHYQVFKSITDYRFVDRDDLMIALGYSKIDEKGQIRYNIDPKNIPIQLCNPKDYRDKVVGGGLIQKHKDKIGIPQGTPISDLLANAYLFEFDLAMNKYASGNGGAYFRYSDDILIILPGDENVVQDAFIEAKYEIKKCGNDLKINKSKTEVTCFTPDNAGYRCYAIDLEESGLSEPLRHNFGLSYLGFRFDGSKVYFRENTISNLRGKIVRTCKAEAYFHVKRHRDKDLKWLLDHSPLEKVRQKFKEVQDFEEVFGEARNKGNSVFKKMTFWSYAKRAIKVFSESKIVLRKQLRNIDALIENKLRKEIISKYKRRTYTDV